MHLCESKNTPRISLPPSIFQLINVSPLEFPKLFVYHDQSHEHNSESYLHLNTMGNNNSSPATPRVLDEDQLRLLPSHVPTIVPVPRPVRKCGRHLSRFQPMCKSHVAECPNKEQCKRDCATCRYIHKSNLEMEERMKKELKRRETLKD